MAGGSKSYDLVYELHDNAAVDVSVNIRILGTHNGVERNSALSDSLAGTR